MIRGQRLYPNGCRRTAADGSGLPPEQKAAGSNPAGGTTLISDSAGSRQPAKPENGLGDTTMT
jgi:hypothetical protein